VQLPPCPLIVGSYPVGCGGIMRMLAVGKVWIKADKPIHLLISWTKETSRVRLLIITG